MTRTGTPGLVGSRSSTREAATLPQPWMWREWGLRGPGWAPGPWYASSTEGFHFRSRHYACRSDVHPQEAKIDYHLRTEQRATGFSSLDTKMYTTPATLPDHHDRAMLKIGQASPCMRSGLDGG